MLSKLRAILRTQYIGSILVALLAWQAAIEIITIAARSGFWGYNHLREHPVLGGSQRPAYPWDNLVFTVVTIVLYLAAAYALARWLYPSTEKSASKDEPSSDQSGSS
jgi:hypothetical protein